MREPESTCLAIADLSGYTAYLSGVELAHAHDIIADLLQAIVAPLRPTFHVAKLEGDAVLLYAPIDVIDGSVLLDLFEGTYVAFRRRLRTIGQTSSCACNACARVPELDLKIVVHHGSAVRQEMLGTVELVGPDVIVVHRLLKNTIATTLASDGYALFTDACLKTTSLDPVLLGMRRHVEHYDDLGEVAGWVHDLAEVWNRIDAVTRAYVERDDAIWSSETFIAGAEPALAWQWLTDPTFKIAWESGFERITETPGDGGRRGAGTFTHCVHGDESVDMEILDWRPPSYVTSRGAFPNGARFVVTDEVTPADGGVIVSKALAAPSAEDEPALREVMMVFAPVLDTWLPRLGDLLSEHQRQRPILVDASLPEPDEDARHASAVVVREDD